MYLASNSLDDARHIMVLNLTVLHPRREPSQLTIVSVIRQPHLWADEQNFSVVNDNPAIVDYILVCDRPARLYQDGRIWPFHRCSHSDIAQNTPGILRLQDLGEHLPRVQSCIPYVTEYETSWTDSCCEKHTF